MEFDDVVMQTKEVIKLVVAQVEEGGIL